MLRIWASNDPNSVQHSHRSTVKINILPNNKLKKVNLGEFIWSIFVCESTREIERFKHRPPTAIHCALGAKMDDTGGTSTKVTWGEEGTGGHWGGREGIIMLFQEAV